MKTHAQHKRRRMLRRYQPGSFATPKHDDVYTHHRRTKLFHLHLLAIGGDDLVTSHKFSFYPKMNTFNTHWLLMCSRTRTHIFLTYPSSNSTICLQWAKVPCYCIHAPLSLFYILNNPLGLYNEYWLIDWYQAGFFSYHCKNKPWWVTSWSCSWISSWPGHGPPPSFCNGLGFSAQGSNKTWILPSYYSNTVHTL